MDPTQRFSSRVNNYVKYRPGYPHAVIDTLEKECGFSPFSLVADIGSGTGALTDLFVRNGNHVFAVEPNKEMREAAEHRLNGYSGFHSVDGRAEWTNLDDGSVELVVVGQAFHWFDAAKAREEFKRILRPSGWAMVVWDERDFESTAFLAAYDTLLRAYAPDYARTKHKHVYDTALDAFYGGLGFTERTFSYRQKMDFEGVKGRMQSSSYTPEPGHPNHVPMLDELQKIYREYEVNGYVTFEYITRMYYGRMA